MRILQVIPVFSAPFGGPVTVVRSISKELAKRHDVTVYTTTALDHKQDLKDTQFEVNSEGYRVVYFPRVLKFIGFNFSPSMSKALQDNINKFDVVHLHSWRHFQDLAVHHYAKKNNIPYILQAHGSIPKIMAKKRLKWIYDVLFGYRLLRDASKVIALSEVEVQQYRSMGVPGEKIAVIPNGIDLSEYAVLPPRGSFKRKFGIKEEEKIVLYLGRIHRGKGIDFLIKSFAHLYKNNTKNVRLVIAGPDDGYLNEARCLVNSLGFDEKVLFTGILSENDKIAAYVDSSVCTYLSMSEPFGLVSLEAAACGTPVIVSIGTPMSQIVYRGKFGFSVNYGNVSDLSKKMNMLICDDALRKEMGRKGREFVFNNFSWNSIITRLEKVYEVAKENQSFTFLNSGVKTALGRSHNHLNSL